MLIAATFLLIIFLGLMGFVLDQSFQRSAEEGVRERLLLQIYGLLAVAEDFEQGVSMPAKLQEPDFNQMGTGLYGLVYDEQGQELWRSQSALDLMLKPEHTEALSSFKLPGRHVFDRWLTSDGNEIFALCYRVVWQTPSQMDVPYLFVVLQTTDLYLGEVQAFRNSLWGWLIGVVIALIILQGMVINWSLAPLKGLAGDLKAIEDGQQDRLRGNYPEELEGVTSNLNMLLASERRLGERYRTTLSDLAHSLKTPLAILHGASASLTGGEKESRAVDTRQAVESIDEQVERMDEIISWQLERAVASTARLSRKNVPVREMVGKIVEAMEKIYEDRGVVFEQDIEDVHFLGDERDILELLGNVVDNACKYGHGQVRIRVAPSESDRSLCIVVEDNGPGIAEDLRESVLQRGLRLDSTEAGQGIGLAIVSEIVDRYEGHIDIASSELGGARVTLTTSSF